MIEEIISEYSTTDYSLYTLCTMRKLKLLHQLYYHPEKLVDRRKYYWEINALTNKLIIDFFTNEIYEDQRENVKIALDKYKARPQKGEDDIVAFMVGLCKFGVNKFLERTISKT